MSKPKYPFEKRLEVVNHYFTTDDGYRIISARFGVPRTQVRTWVALYEKHGEKGLIPKPKEVAIKWSAAPDMTPQTVLYRRPVAQFSNFQPKIVSSWLILALFQANFLISGRSRLCPYQLVNSNQVRQGE